MARVIARNEMLKISKILWGEKRPLAAAAGQLRFRNAFFRVTSFSEHYFPGNLRSEETFKWPRLRQNVSKYRKP